MKINTSWHDIDWIDVTKKVNVHQMAIAVAYTNNEMRCWRDSEHAGSWLDRWSSRGGSSRGGIA
jgi:hypothetical protein